MKHVYHPDLKGRKLNTPHGAVQLDEAGRAVVDDRVADYLKDIPGYNVSPVSVSTGRSQEKPAAKGSEKSEKKGFVKGDETGGQE